MYITYVEVQILSPAVKTGLATMVARPFLFGGGGKVLTLPQPAEAVVGGDVARTNRDANSETSQLSMETLNENEPVRKCSLNANVFTPDDSGCDT